MLAPFLISSAFILAVVLLCFVRPNAGRIFLGFFFLAMALGVNGSFTFGNPQSYVDYAAGALIPFYRDIATAVISISPVAFGILLMAFEITMGTLILHKGRSVKIGLAGTMLFLAGMAPLSWLQVPWLGLIVAEAYLFRREFDASVVELLLLKFDKGMPRISDKP